MCIDCYIRLVKGPKIAVKKIPKTRYHFRKVKRKLKFWINVDNKNFNWLRCFLHWKLTLKVRFWRFLTSFFGYLFDEKINALFLISAILSSFWSIFDKFCWRGELLTAAIYIKVMGNKSFTFCYPFIQNICQHFSTKFSFYTKIFHPSKWTENLLSFFFKFSYALWKQLTAFRGSIFLLS